MGDKMEFPETFEEFVEQYGFIDTEETYTNASWLIQVYRVKQWLEHTESHKVGKWIPKTQYEAMCSACDNIESTDGADLTGKALVHKALFKYCLNCGAKME